MFTLTSGWHYNHWRNSFYPEDVDTRDFLRYYSQHFLTVEINNSFYKLPTEQTLQLWKETSPDAFVFAAKGSRYITHMKKLKDPEATISSFFERIRVLGNKLGPVLFQLPPRWRCNPQRLRRFLLKLPPEHRCAFEFRDPSWFDDRVYEALAETDTAFCIYESAGRKSPKKITADLIYVRLHGAGDAYEGSYSRSTLAGWAGAFSAWQRQGKEIYWFFDNDEAGYAAQNALALQGMMS
jgi:uncharacterized protein YecE (DUF72 family)